MDIKNYICPNCNETSLHEVQDGFICDSCEHTYTSEKTEYGGIKFIDTTDKNTNITESQVDSTISKPNENIEYYDRVYINLKNTINEIYSYFKDIDEKLNAYLNDKGFFKFSDKDIYIKQDSFNDTTYTSVIDLSDGFLDISAYLKMNDTIIDGYDIIHSPLNESTIDDMLDNLEEKGKENWSEADWELINHADLESGKFEGSKPNNSDESVLTETIIEDSSETKNTDNLNNIESSNGKSNLKPSDDLIDADENKPNDIKLKYLKIDFAETSGAPSDDTIAAAIGKEFDSIEELNRILFIADREFRDYWAQNGGVFGYDKVYITARYEDSNTGTKYSLDPFIRIDLGDGKYGREYISISDSVIKQGADSIINYEINDINFGNKIYKVNESLVNSQVKKYHNSFDFDKDFTV